MPINIMDPLPSDLLGESGGGAVGVLAVDIDAPPIASGEPSPESGLG